ncbi:hypothetical protein ACLIIZ_12310 [Azonexus caeni]|jgi:hypothetical protein|uniref:hypothetical protein n=1 Tax=Azonexus caeni TaxID=266126 RepID=UPI003A87E50E
MPISFLPLPPAGRLTRPDYLREAMLRGERPARDERIDRPEIQESYRVSLSDEVVVEAASAAPEALRRPREENLSPAGARALAAYGAVAET